MVVTYINSGEYLSWKVENNVITFDNTLSLDMNKLQRGYKNIVDVYSANDGSPTLEPTEWYLAQITIPKRTYTVSENGIADEMGLRQIEKTPDPLNENDIILALWAKEV